jgi:hypothetical protein
VTTNRDQLQELIQADLDGELSVTERADLARLLLRDPEARRLHNEFRQTDQLLRDIAAAEPPPGLRAAILAGPARAAGPGDPGDRQYSRPLYRIAAVILGGLLIVGLSYLLIDTDVPRSDLQGSLGAAVGPEPTRLIAPQDHLTIRAEGAEVSASLQRIGQTLRLELNVSTISPCEVIARFDPATTTFVGSAGDTRMDSASGQAAVQLATGRQVFVLDFSGAAPIQLQLRSGGRLLGEGRLSVSDR